MPDMKQEDIDAAFAAYHQGYVDAFGGWLDAAPPEDPSAARWYDMGKAAGSRASGRTEGAQA